MSENVAIHEILKRIRTHQAERRREFRDLHDGVVSLARVVGRMDQQVLDVERQVVDIRPELETVVRMEFVGLKDHVDAKLDAKLEEHLEAVKTLLQPTQRP